MHPQQQYSHGVGLWREFISRHFLLLMILTLGLHSGILAWEAAKDSATVDEVGHFAAGIEHWYHGSFRFFCVNPPLVRMIAMAPIAMRAHVPDPTLYPERIDPQSRPEFPAGRLLAADIGYRYFSLLAAARLMVLPLSILGGLICCRWSTVLFGKSSGLLALLLWCFSPTVLAFGHLITPDVGAASLAVAACYAFRRWLALVTIKRALLAGCILGLAELAKSTLIVLFPLFAVFWLVRPRGWRVARRSLEVAQLLIIFLLALWIINLGYGFEGAAKPVGEFNFISQTLAGTKDVGDPPDFHGNNRFAATALAHLRVPLPENYVLGIDYLKWEFERKKWSYLNGEWRLGGWWYYYLYAIAVKEPAGTLLLFAAALVALLLTKVVATGGKYEELLIFAPLVCFLVVVSSGTGYNHHLRYASPCFPFLFIVASRAARLAEKSRWPIQALIFIAAGCSVGDSLMVCPHSIAYFNQIVGGPYNGHRHLEYGNTDYGQDLLYIKSWSDAHPGAEPLYLAYRVELFPWEITKIKAERELAGPYIGNHLDRTGPTAGWHVVSTDLLHDRRHRYDYFLGLKPVEYISYTTVVYHISDVQAAEIHRRQGTLKDVGRR